MSIKSDNFSEIIGLIYEAAGDSSAWRAAVSLLLRDFDTPIGGFDFEAHKPDFNRDTAVSINFDSVVLQTYLDEFRSPDVNIGMRALVNAPLGRAFNMTSFMDRETYRTEPSTVAVLHPQKIDKALMVTLDRTPGSFGFFSLYRRNSDDDFSDDQLVQFTNLANHIRRAWQLKKRLTAAEMIVADVAKNFECTGTIRGMLVLGHNFKIIEADVGAQAILAGNFGLTERMGKMCSSSSASKQSTADLWTYMKQSKVVSQPFAISDRETYATTIQVYSGHIQSRIGSAQNLLRVDITTTILAVGAGLERLNATFGLTRAEGRVVSALTTAKNASQAARELGISRETMKSHLNRIYDKTGASSITQLMLIAGRFLRPGTSQSNCG